METVFIILTCVLAIACAFMGCILLAKHDIATTLSKKHNVTIVINGKELPMRLTKREERVISDMIARYAYSYDIETIFLKREK